MTMDGYDLVVHGATLVRGSGLDMATVAVRDGRIAAILPASEKLPAAETTIDASGLHLLPGGVDAHVHFRDPGMPEAEDFGSGSRAAVAGGVTTVLDMPNTTPPTTTVAALKAKALRAEATSLCDFGLFAGATADNADGVARLAKAGAIGIKCYAAPSTGGLSYPGAAGFAAALKAASRSGLRLALHAEDAAMVAAATGRLREARASTADCWSEARPPEAELTAIEAALTVARNTGAKLHICHLSVAAAVPLIAAARRSGLKVTCEATPHHALLDLSAYQDLGTAGRVNPPFRNGDDREAIFAALARGEIEMVASDHAPHSAEAKASESVWEGASGFSGVQLLMPLMLSEAVRGRLELSDVALLTAERPAKAWGLWPRKGHIVVGADADLAIFDLRGRLTVSLDWLRGRSRNIAFEGWELRAEPKYTFVRGRLQFAEGEVIGAPMGRNLGA